MGIERRISVCVLAICISASAVAGPRKDAAQAKAKEWAACVLTAAQLLAKSNEATELVVKASFGECAEAEAQYEKAVGRVFNDPLRMEESPDEATLTLRQEKVRRALSEASLAAVIKARLVR